MTEADWRTLVVEWYPQLADTRLRQVSWPAIEPHRDYIHGQLQVGVTAATIHQRRECSAMTPPSQDVGGDPVGLLPVDRVRGLRVDADVAGAEGPLGHAHRGRRVVHHPSS